MTRAERLRELAAWYREFAEKTGNPQIWAARLKHAEGLEAEAERLRRFREKSNWAKSDNDAFHASRE
jgi:hypothetical protein